MIDQATFVIIGGGIAGVSCAEGIAFLEPDFKIILISATPTIKKVTNLSYLTKLLTKFDVEEMNSNHLSNEHPSITVVQGYVTSVDTLDKIVYTSTGDQLMYEKLCICSGASPKLISNNPRVLGIRDTDSVAEFQKRVSSSRRMVVVGNGGIATELVHETEGMEIIWVIKDKHIGATFIDPGAAKFFHDKLQNRTSIQEPQKHFDRFTVENQAQESHPQGAALGPQWHDKISLQGLLDERRITVEYCCEVNEIKEGDNEWPVYIELTNNKTIGCDFIVSATGVHPNTEFISDGGFDLATDGGIKVNWKMETSISEIYAAGDVCTANWEIAPHWFQMRLWTQARQMGHYAAKAMISSIKNEELIQDFCFELFTHVTKFFGMKVILLGLFNAQKIENEPYEIQLRYEKGSEYIKLILKDGRMQGAVLIGEDTELDEMCENLILDQLKIDDLGIQILDPSVDIADYFD